MIGINEDAGSQAVNALGMIERLEKSLLGEGIGHITLCVALIFCAARLAHDKYMREGMLDEILAAALETHPRREPPISPELARAIERLMRRA